MSQFERIACIDRLLREQGSVRTTEVAERFEVSGRQVKRDIEYLRDPQSVRDGQPAPAPWPDITLVFQQHFLWPHLTIRGTFFCRPDTATPTHCRTVRGPGGSS